MLRFPNIKLHIDKAKTLSEELEALKKEILFKLNLNENELISFKIFKKSIDARKKNEIYFVYTVDLELMNPKKIFNKYARKGMTEAPNMNYSPVTPGTEKLSSRPVVIGMGPAGIFAGLFLSRFGYKPIILERGEDVDTRTLKVNRFWKEGVLDTESNVQFGEGGAGSFSDGKLTTLINDKRCRTILEALIQAGAPEEILYTNKAHIGTDLLKTVMKKIREEIIQNGGEVRFKAKVTDFIIHNHKLEGVIINNSERLDCTVALLGIGHSARDTFEVLHERGITITQKPFSIGARIEHPQEFIDRAQYGSFAKHPSLGAADYKLVYHSEKGRSAYTFCMCPGGYVIAAQSEEKSITVNGMSEHSRNGRNANSALLVEVRPEDFDSEHPLAGVEFQRKWEHLAYEITGHTYQAPVQLVGDFLADKPSTAFGLVKPTYTPGVAFAELKHCLPDFVVETMRDALKHFDTMIKGFDMKDAILTGVETRSSSPIRINRNENYLSNIAGLYPMGEGAGYAGGIMSSAVDGVRTAEKVMEHWGQPNMYQ